MDDVRALKRMVSETKETLELQKQERLFKSREMRQSITKNGPKYYLGGPSSQLKIHHAQSMANYEPKPVQSYADLIAQKYQRQEQEQIQGRQLKNRCTTANTEMNALSGRRLIINMDSTEDLKRD